VESEKREERESGKWKAKKRRERKWKVERKRRERECKKTG
jgi:hypothetical protein